MTNYKVITAKFSLLVLLLISAIIYFISQIGGCSEPEYSTSTTVIKTYDSNTVSHSFRTGDTSGYVVILSGVDTQYYPVWKTDTVHDTVHFVIDTNAIIKAWLNTAKYFTQVIRDSDLYISIEDTVYQNEIVWRKVDRKILRPQTITTVTNTPIPKPRVKIYAGGQLGLSRQALGVMPGLLITDRKSRAFTIGYQFNYPYPNNLTIGFYYPINK